MSDTPNYNESTASGTSWQRAVRVVVENPYQAVPSIVFVEEVVYSIGEKVIKEPCCTVSTAMNPADPLHLEIYTKLNELYVLLREQRDAQVPLPDPIMMQPPIIPAPEPPSGTP